MNITKLVQLIAGFAVMIAVVTGIIYAATATGSVGITQEGKCKWVEIAPDFERRDCPEVLPVKYNKIIVE